MSLEGYRSHSGTVATHDRRGHPLNVSMPANVLLINEVPDAQADGRTGKRTLVVILGLDGTRRLYLFLNALAPIAVLLLVGRGIVAPFAIVGPLYQRSLSLTAVCPFSHPD